MYPCHFNPSESQSSGWNNKTTRSLYSKKPLDLHLPSLNIWLSTWESSCLGPNISHHRNNKHPGKWSQKWPNKSLPIPSSKLLSLNKEVWVQKDRHQQLHILSLSGRVPLWQWPIHIRQPFSGMKPSLPKTNTTLWWDKTASFWSFCLGFVTSPLLTALWDNWSMRSLLKREE